MTSKILNSLPHLANDSVTKQVTDILSDLIVTGKIVEGDFLPTEEDLCHEFGIGRSSVREAIKTLESRGMVRKLHGKGVEVIDESAKATTEMLHISLRMKKTTVRDFMEFRKSMEIKMTEMAACRATSEQVKTIEEVLEKMKTDEYRLETFADYDAIKYGIRCRICRKFFKIMKSCKFSVSENQVKMQKRRYYI